MLLYWEQRLCVYAKIMTLSSTQLGTQQRSNVPLIAITTGSASGAIILCILAFVVLISVTVCLKCRQKAFNLTTNFAYTGQCTNESNDDCIDYTASQPLSVLYETIEDPETITKSGEDALTRLSMITTENVAYQASHSSSLFHNVDHEDNTTDLETQQPSKGALSLV